MEDKRGVKRERSPSAEESPLPDDPKTPPSSLSGSLPPPESRSEVLSRHCCSPMFDQGSASGVTLVSVPSSLIADTSHDEEFTRKLFGDLNRDILGPPGDGKIIIIDDSDDDDDEAQEEETADIEPTAVPAFIPMLLQEERMIIVMIRRPMVVTTADEVIAILRLSRRSGHPQRIVLHFLCFCFVLCNL
jgi:hypothetical protein